jgi:hypothetical protein
MTDQTVAIISDTVATSQKALRSCASDSERLRFASTPPSHYQRLDRGAWFIRNVVRGCIDLHQQSGRRAPAIYHTARCTRKKAPRINAL